jgi:hypothetical protein
MLIYNYDALTAEMEPAEAEAMAYHIFEAAKLGASTGGPLRFTLKSNAEYFVTYNGMLSSGDTHIV